MSNNRNNIVDPVPLALLCMTNFTLALIVNSVTSMATSSLETVTEQSPQAILDKLDNLRSNSQGLYATGKLKMHMIIQSYIYSQLFPSKIKENAHKNMYSYKSMIVSCNIYKLRILYIILSSSE